MSHNMYGAISGSDILLARMLGAKAGFAIKISKSLTTFATDGKIVYVPESLPYEIAESLNKKCVSLGVLRDGVKVEDAVRDVFLGALAHEVAGHIRMTDFDVRLPSSLENSVLNMLEDIRIERTIPLHFPGAKALLGKLVGYMANDLFWRADDDVSTINIIGFHLMRRMRSEILGQGAYLTDEYLKEIEWQIAARNLTSVAEQCYQIAKSAIVISNCTGDLSKASTQIAKLLAQAEKQQQPQDQLQGQPQEQSEGESEDQSQGQSQEQSEGESEDQSQGQSQEQSEGESEDQSQGQPQEQSEGESEDQSQGQSNDVDEEIQSILNNREIDDTDLLSSVFKSGENELRNSPISKHSDSTKRKLEFNHVMTPSEYREGAKISSYIRSGLRETLQSLLEDEDDSDEKFGRFNTRRIAQAITGTSDHVFTVDGDEAPGIDAHVEILLDRSGSMMSHESAIRSISYGVVDALGSIPEVNLSIIAYDDFCYDITGTPLKMRNQVKGYTTGGGTNWSRAFDSAFIRFAQSKKSRKILITITDGDVNIDDDIITAMKLMNVEDQYLYIGNSSQFDLKKKVPSKKIACIPDICSATILAKSILTMLKNSLQLNCR